MSNHQMEVPSKEDTKFFIVIGSKYVHDNDGIPYTNSFLLARFVKNVLKLPKESIHIFSPISFEDFVSMSKVSEIKYRDLINLYYTDLKEDDIKFEVVSSDEGVYKKISEHVAKNTYAFLQFYGHESEGNFGQDEMGHLYQFLANLNAKSKRVYIHASNSGTIVDLAKLCAYIQELDNAWVGPLHQLVQNSIDLNSEESNLSQLQRILNSVTNISVSIFIKADNVNRTTPDRKPYEKLFQGFQIIAKIFAKLQKKSRNYTQEYFRTLRETENIREFDSGSINDMINDYPSWSPFINAAIEEGIENADEIKTLASWIFSVLENKSIDYQGVSDLIKAEIRSNKRDLVEFYKEVCIIKNIINAMLSQYCPITVGLFLNLIKEGTLPSLEDTKILVSPHLARVRHPTLIGKIDYEQNDPVACEYFRSAFLKPSLYGIDLKEICERVELMGVMIDRPQYYQTNYVSNDSLLNIILENGIKATPESILKRCGYALVNDQHKHRTFFFPPVKISVEPREPQTPVCPISKYYISDDKSKMVMCKTAFDDTYQIELYVDLNGANMFSASGDSYVEWKGLPAYEPPENLINYNLSISNYDQIDQPCPSGHRIFKPYPGPDEIFPTDEDDIFDPRFLMVGPDMKCGLGHLDMFNENRNRKWAIFYNTLRLYSRYLENKGIEFKDYINLDTQNMKRYVLNPVPMMALCWTDSVKHDLNSELSVFACDAINDLFEKYSDRVDELKAIYIKASDDAHEFVDRNLHNVLLPLIRHRNSCLR